MSDLLALGVSVIALFVTVAAAWFTYRQAFPPDRRLEIGTSEGPDGPDQTLVNISNKGKYGVSPEQFGNQPLTLTLDPPAQSVVWRKLSTDRTAMQCEARDGKLIIHQGTIAVDESLSILVETGDTGTATVTHYDHQMPEVKFTKARRGRTRQRQRNEPRRPRALGLQLVVSAVLAGASLLAAILAIVSVLSPPPISLTPIPVAPGETATVCGSDLHPFDIVKVDLDWRRRTAAPLATGQVDANGDFCTPFRVSETMGLGNYDLEITLVDGDHYTNRTVEMSVAAK